MKDIVVFSHLRWDFVFQRPQHIMSILARQHRILFIEEEIFTDEPDGYHISLVADRIFTIRPHLQKNIAYDITDRKRKLLDRIMIRENVVDYMAWYYTPMAYDFSNHLQHHVIVYDCMDELSAFLFAPPELIKNEQRLLQAADLVFTGGYSLYEAKKNLHPAVFCFPSSIDKTHFEQARQSLDDPADQTGIGYPRMGFFGVIDERFDSKLIKAVALQKPDWQFVFLGSVVKIDPQQLPHLPNIHYLGMKTYQELPAYLSNWQIAILPFAINESTKYISPTKTPEYLAAGKPVISTPIKDVVRSYGENGLVAIAHNADTFIEAGQKLLSLREEEWLTEVDAFLKDMSWENTVAEMLHYIESVRLTSKEKV